MDELRDLEVISYSGGKGGQDKPYVPYETPNNLISVATAKVLLALGEGEFAERPLASEIYLNGTPLVNSDGTENFGGVKWEWRSGSQVQEHIQGMPNVSNEISVNVEVLDTRPYVRDITNKSLDATRVTVQFPALMEQTSKGDTIGVVVVYAIDVATDGGPYIEYNKYTVDGKTNGTYEQTRRINLPPANSGWTIRVRRITPKSESSLIQNSMNVKSVADVADVKQFYPNTALLYVEFDSRSFGGGSIPRISVKQKMRVIRVPSNYDPATRTYTGIWDGVFKWAWTNNPAWVFFDIVTNSRFGLGNRLNINQIDKWELYDIARWCDVMVPKGDGSGNLEPRHTCNIYIQSQNDAWSILRDICSIFNGMTYWDGSKFIARADKRENLNNLPLFSRSNVVNGDFDYGATDERTISTSALISFDDPENHYNTAVEATWEQSEILRWGGDKQVEIAAIGCTSRGEAQRKGKYTLLTNMNNRSVKFSTGLQGLDEKIFPGKVIAVADPLIAGKPFTGRLTAGTPRVVTLDRDTEAKAGDTLFITDSNGVMQGRTVESVALGGKVVTLLSAYSETPSKNQTWYLEASDLKSQLFRVVKISYADKGISEIEAVQYVDGKYEAIDNGASLEDRPISKVPPSFMPPVASVELSSYSYVEQTMAVSVLRISWPQTPNAVSYQVEWRISNGDWIPAGTVGSTEVEIKGIYSGTYVARVRAINALDIKSNWASSLPTNIVGKVGLPPTLASFTATGLIYGLSLEWAFPNGAEDTARTEIMYGVVGDFTKASKLGDYAYPTDSMELHGLLAGAQLHFWARLVDRTGNVGEWYPDVSSVGVVGRVSINDNGAYNEYYENMIGESALNKEMSDRIDLIDGNGPGSVNERINEASQELQDQIDQIVDLSDSMPYNPSSTYTDGQAVLGPNGRLYQAIGNVPENTPPPNINYWLDIGETVTTANGLASQVSINTADISKIDGRITASASQLESIQAAFREDDGEGELADALKGWDSQARISNVEKVTASQNRATAERISTIEANVGKSSGQIAALESVVVTNEVATVRRFTETNAIVNGNTSSISNLQTVVTNNQETTATAITQVNSRIDSTNNGLANEISDRQASVSAEATTRLNADNALGLRITNTESSIGDNSAKISQIETAQVDLEKSVSNMGTTVSSTFSASRKDDGEGELAAALESWGSQARFSSEVKTRASADESLVRATQTLQSQVNGNTSSIQTVAQTQATTDGKLQSMWSVKAQINSNGQYVAAGIGLGIENGPAGLQSMFLVNADTFAVVNGTDTVVTSPFVISGGQVFIKQALIGEGYITNAMIGQFIQSNNYVAGSTGWRLDKNGTFEINGSVAGSGRMVITNQAIKVYDAGNVLRVQMGNLTV